MSAIEPPARAPGRGGAFTTAGCDGGAPLLWPDHLARLAATLESLRPGRPAALPQAAEVSARLRDRGLEGPGRARLSAAPDDRSGCGWRIVLELSPCVVWGPLSVPVRLGLHRWRAAPAGAGHKLLDRTPWVRALESARGKGAEDVLLVDAAERVLETAVANVLVVSGGRILTPPAPRRCLPGVMRGWLLRSGPSLGLDVVEREITLDRLLAADEVWISNAVIGFRRVAAVGSRTWSTWAVHDELRRLEVPAPGWSTRVSAPHREP